MHRRPVTQQETFISSIINATEPKGRAGKPVQSKKTQEQVKQTFKRISAAKPEELREQFESEGLIVKSADIEGEILTNRFYSNVCPNCSKNKVRKAKCTECGFEEEALEEVAFASLM